MVPAPNTISTTAPPIDIHLLNKGALFSSHPVAPPANMMIGEIAVPTPNKTANRKLSKGAAKVADQASNAINGVQITSPLVNPNVKALKSNLPSTPWDFVVSGGKLPFTEQLGAPFRFFISMWAPMIIVTMPKKVVE